MLDHVLGWLIIKASQIFADFWSIDELRLLSIILTQSLAQILKSIRFYWILIN